MKSNNNIKDKETPKRFKLVSYCKEEWEIIKSILLELKNKCINEKLSVEQKFIELYSVIQKFQNKYRTKQYIPKKLNYLNKKNCIGLQKAINSYFNDKSFFYLKLLPFIIEQALLIEERAKNKYGEQTLPLMPSTLPMKESFPKKLVLSILSNNFFCNDQDYVSQLNPEQKKLTQVYEWNIVDWFALYSIESSVAIQRIICFLAYFDFAYKIFEIKNNYFESDITVERIVFNFDEIKNKLLECENVIEEKDINIHCKDMDNPEIETQSIVNFANKNFQTGEIIPSATQEEVLFYVRPELYIAMFICQTVYKNEIIIISGAYKLMEYDGYLSTFTFKKFKDNIFIKDYNFKKYDNENVLCLDATSGDHYYFDSVMQDISKFYSACNYSSKKYENSGISTGSWGCGAFGCDKAHKFLQQLVCAEANNVKLSFSTFGNENYKNDLIKLLKSVIKYKPKVKDLFKLIIDFKGNNDEKFHEYLKGELGDEFYLDKDISPMYGFIDGIFSLIN